MMALLTASDDFINGQKKHITGRNNFEIGTRDINSFTEKWRKGFFRSDKPYLFPLSKTIYFNQTKLTAHQIW